MKTLSKHKKLIILSLVGLAGFLVSSSILKSLFIGEDEALYIRVCRDLLASILRLDIRTFAATLLAHDHPPFPILMVTPFIYLMGYTEAALRMPNVLLWTLNCIVAARIGWKLGGWKVGLVSGLLLAVSGIYDVEALGFGQAGEVLFVFLLIEILLDDFKWNLDSPEARRKYLWGGTFLAIGYLFYTSTLPIILVYHLLFGYKMLKANFSLQTFRKYINFTLPFIAFYLVYNLIFLGIPAYRVYIQGVVQPYGQLRQNLGRAKTGLNINSLLENLQVINWYVFPFTSWLVLAAGLYRQGRKYFDIFLILLGFGAIWSFYLNGNTGQHFLAYYCWAVPFGIDYLFQSFSQKNLYVQALTWGAVLCVLFTWTYTTHTQTYTHDTYPNALITMTWGKELGWINNLDRPMHEISGNLSDVLHANDGYISLIDGALNLFYFPDETKYAGDIQSLQTRTDPKGQCFIPSAAVVNSGKKIRAVVMFTDQHMCPELVASEIHYPGSNIKLAVLLP